MDYCQNLVNVQPARNQLDVARELNTGSPVAAVGNTLATFMGNRLSMSFVNLGCANFGLTNPVTVTLDGNMVATAVAYTAAEQTAKAPAAATPTADRHRYGRHRWSRRWHRRPADQAAPGRTQVPGPVRYVAREAGAP